MKLVLHEGRDRRGTGKGRELRVKREFREDGGNG